MRNRAGGLSREAGHEACCGCFIVPPSVLKRFAKDKKLSAEEREHFANAVKLEREWRRARAAIAKATHVARTVLPAMMSPAAVQAAPAVLVFDCKHGTALPGTPVANPGASSDATAKRTFTETTQVVKFYKTIFNRNSLDDAGMSLISSIHFSVKYNNAAWTGNQMKYGDGDGNIFVDFTRARDVIGHELTHGVTQYTAALQYANQPGGLNESMSDVFGSMFRQWRSNQTVNKADWLIGKEIMGPGAIARGYTCLRDMANPAAKHCLAPQPTKFSQYHNGMDPHESSGIPNLAFHEAAMAIGGKSWEKTGQIWYQALTGFKPSPNLTMKQFADRTRTVAGTLYPAPPIKAAVDQAWKTVGL